MITDNILVQQKDAVKESRDRFNENRSREWGLYGADTGHHNINMTIGGWIPKKLTVIAARSGHGKTALTPQMFEAGRRIEAGKRAEYAFFSWETGASYIVDRSVCRMSSLTLRQLTQASKLLGEKSLMRLRDAYEKAKSLPVHYHLNSTNINEVADIFMNFSNRCRKLSDIEEVDVIPVFVVDYVGLAEYKGSNRAYDVAEFVNGAKRLVNETGGSGCIFAQIKRAADEKEYPDRGDISDSQAIEQAADNLIIWHRPEYVGESKVVDPDTNEHVDATNKGLMRVLKCRDGATGDKLVGCDIKFFRFYDLYHNWDFPYWEQYRKRDFWLNEFGLSERDAED